MKYIWERWERQQSKFVSYDVLGNPLWKCVWNSDTNDAIL